MDTREIIRSLVEAAISIEEYLAPRTPMTDPEVKKLHGGRRGDVSKALSDRGYSAYEYRPSKKGGEFFTRSFRHPKGHRIELRFDGDEVVRKAIGTHGPKEGAVGSQKRKQALSSDED